MWRIIDLPVPLGQVNRGPQRSKFTACGLWFYALVLTVPNVCAAHAFADIVDDLAVKERD
jgi:hypothetical protein